MQDGVTQDVGRRREKRRRRATLVGSVHTDIGVQWRDRYRNCLNDMTLNYVYTFESRKRG